MLTPEETKRVATDNEVLRVRVGSGVLGLSVADTDDEDLMGVFIEPPEFVLGLKRIDQWVSRTQPEGVRSGPGDVDLTIFSLRKWMRLAAAGNPSIILALFVPEEHTLLETEEGKLLRWLKQYIVSQQAGARYLGYLHSQRQRMLGLKAPRSNRPELIDQYGFDTKFAYHAIRLGLQGIELLETGNLTLPMLEPYRSEVLSIRTGGYNLEYVLDWAAGLEARLETLTSKGVSVLPKEPNWPEIHAGMARLYELHWAKNAK